MQKLLILLSLAGVAIAMPASKLGGKRGGGGCSDVQIPVTVSDHRYIVDVAVEDDWDAVQLTFNLTSRDFGTADDPNPIAGLTPSPVESNYSIGATLCGSGETMLVLTHGIIESKLYFQPNLSNSSEYSFVDAAMAAGFSVLSYDRIGVGSSSKVDAYTDAQFEVQVDVLNSLATYARETAGASNVALVGHSYGAYISAQSAASLATAIDALVLTGFSGNFTYFGPFVAGASFRVANILDPERWGHLGTGYLTSSDVYAETYAYFAKPYFEPRIAQWVYDEGSEPFAVGELPSLLGTTMAYENITAPTLLLQGKYDVSACGGDCVGLLDETKTKFSSASVVEIVDDLPAG